MSDQPILSELTSVSYLTMTEECDKIINRIYGETDTVLAMQNKFPNVAECAEMRRLEQFIKFETLHGVMLKIIDKLEMTYEQEESADEVQRLESDCI